MLSCSIGISLALFQWLGLLVDVLVNHFLTCLADRRKDVKLDTTALLHHYVAIKASIVHLVVGVGIFAVFMSIYAVQVFDSSWAQESGHIRFYCYLFGVSYASLLLAK